MPDAPVAVTTTLVLGTSLYPATISHSSACLKIRAIAIMYLCISTPVDLVHMPQSFMGGAR